MRLSQYRIPNTTEGDTRAMVKVSVVIPVYNVEKYLPACLDSVLGQSLREIECICIDDASPDRCGEILDEYAQRDSRVRVLHLSENHMQGYGRNRGIELASGEYIYLLDSDDMITPTALEELYDVAKRDELDGIFFDSQAIYESEQLQHYGSSYIGLRKGQYPDAVVSGQELLECFQREKEWMVYVQREFWRREFLVQNEIRFPERRTEHEDELFSFEAILLAERTRYLRKDYFIRRYRADSVMTRKPHPKDFHGYFCIYYQMAEFVERHGISSAAAEACVFTIYDNMLVYLGDFENGARPEDWFTPAEQERYRFFRALLRSRKLYDARDRKLWEPLRHYDELKIYGAGRIGRRVHMRLSDAGLEVTSFLVTERAGNPASLAGVPVEALDEIATFPENCAVIVAMSRSLCDGPAALLEQRGVRYYLYLEGSLFDPYGEGTAQA